MLTVGMIVKVRSENLISASARRLAGQTGTITHIDMNSSRGPEYAQEYALNLDIEGVSGGGLWSSEVEPVLEPIVEVTGDVSAQTFVRGEALPLRTMRQVMDDMLSTYVPTTPFEQIASISEEAAPDTSHVEDAYNYFAEYTHTDVRGNALDVETGDEPVSLYIADGSGEAAVENIVLNADVHAAQHNVADLQRRMREMLGFPNGEVPSVDDIQNVQAEADNTGVEWITFDTESNNGVLTQEAIEEAARIAAENHGQPEYEIRIAHGRPGIENYMPSFEPITFEGLFEVKKKKEKKPRDCSKGHSVGRYAMQERHYRFCKACGEVLKSVA